jgi:hypothetical protein
VMSDGLVVTAMGVPQELLIGANMALRCLAA